MATYRIHPGIGIARLGNSETSFYIAPETPAGLPFDCDANGEPIMQGETPALIKTFKDAEGRVRRQAARFQVFVYDEASPEGRPLKLGDRIEGGGNAGTLVDIQWRVWLANKKASWYQFSARRGEHGYGATAPRRNANVTDRDRLIIDPGPRTVDLKQRTARFDRSGDGVYAPTFPPPDLKPFAIDTLGELKLDTSARLLVLGGHGHSGCELTGPGHPSIQAYANNDGWFDDTSDGPVMARLVMNSELVQAKRYVDVDFPAWVIVGYPAFVPQILDMITMDELVHDMGVREFATNTRLYGRAGSFEAPDCINPTDAAALRHWRAGILSWNRAYKPWFYRDIWPIVFRPNEFIYLCNVLAQSNFPHDQEMRGTFDPDKIGKTPKRVPTRAGLETAMAAFAAHDAAGGEARTSTLRVADPVPGPEGDWVVDPYRPMRQFLFDLLRRRGEENAFKLEDRIGTRVHNLPLMPMLCGDNPLTNEVPSKFLRLTDEQLFLLGQWADGHFLNELEQGLPLPAPVYFPYPQTPSATGHTLDRGVLANVLGGAFCPGGEVGWIMRNPSVYREPYRIKADRNLADFRCSAAQANAAGLLPNDDVFSIGNPLSQDNDFATGLQPGDLTKSMAQPWQSDFNECTTQTINITYADWNRIDPGNENDLRLKAEEKTWETLWWPAHRPLQTMEFVGRTADGTIVTDWTTWSRGVPQTPAGDLAMVSEWSKLGFILRNPDPSYNDTPSPGPDARYFSIERAGSPPYIVQRSQK